MKKYYSFAIVCLIVALAVVGCQSSAPAPTSAPASQTGEGDLEANGSVTSADGKFSVIGKSQLLVALKDMTNPPAAPAGWEFVGPVFDVTAQDRQRRPVQKLAAALELRFDVPTDRAVTVMVYGDQGWDIVPSEIDADGKLTADVNHLTPYVAAAPKPGNATRRPATIVPKITPSPKATVVSAPASTSDAQSALESAVTSIKQKKIKVTSAAGYTGSLYVALPGSIQSTLDSVSANGAAYYGLYNAVNEAFTAQANGSASSGALTLLAEPKTAFPASAADARTALTSEFPGVPVSSLTSSRADSSAYVFYGTSGSTAYSVGYVTYNGVTLAYAMVGSGTYESLVPKQ